MDLHDLIVDELINKKSLSALIWLINHGRELELSVENIPCFISHNKSNKTVSLWVNQSEQSFNSMEELIQNSTVNEKPFLLLWNDAVIETLF